MFFEGLKDLKDFEDWSNGCWKSLFAFSYESPQSTTQVLLLL